MEPKTLLLVSHALAAACVVVCAVTECSRRKIYNAVTYPAAALGLALAFARGGGDGLEWSAVGMSVGLAIPLVFFVGGMIGGGDVKLLGAAGALGGWPFVVYASAYSFGLGALMALGVLMARIGPLGGLRGALRIVACVFVPVAPTEAEERAGRITLPFGVAIAAGVIWRLVEEGLGRSLFGW